MNREQRVSTEQSGPGTSAGAWGMRYPGLVMGKGGKNAVKEMPAAGMMDGAAHHQVARLQ